MAAPPNPVADEKSLSRLLLELFWQIAVLVLPIMAVTLLPPFVGLAVVLGCAALTGLLARSRFAQLARGCNRLLTSAVFGLGFSLARVLPEYWNILGAFASIFAGLAGASAWERRLGLTAPPGTMPASAWGGGEPRLTPEGEPIRIFNQGEIAMGGPTYCDYLFPDGILLEGLGASACFSSDGRYFAAAVPSREAWGLVILDRSQRRLYRCVDNAQFWELDEFTEQVLRGRYSPLMENSPQQALLQDLLQAAEMVELLPLLDLWLEPGAWQASLAREHFSHSSNDGRQHLDAQLQLPDRLRDLPQPMAPLLRPSYRLSINGEVSDLLIEADTPLLWRDDGRALACLARPLNEKPTPSPYWLWQADGGWRALPQPWVAADGEPSFYWAAPLQLSERYLWVEAYLDYPQPDFGRYGYSLQSIHSDTETQAGCDPQGRMRVLERPLTPIRLGMPLHSDGTRGTTRVESAPLLGGARAHLNWLRDDASGLGAYACSLGDWRLPGEWRLDHRVSDCGRYLALVPFTMAPAMPGQVVVADALERRLLFSPPLLVARLLEFREGRLSLAVIRGRLDQANPGGPLQRFDQPAPAAAVAAPFCAYREDSRLYYESCELRLDPSGLLPVPAWRLVSQPQVAEADGDFIQPAPGNRDAAWLFGSHTEYADSWLRQHSVRMGAYLLTASGCALDNLAPSMIWSADGRYLALTRLCTGMDEPDEGPMAWQLLLLDVQARSLRRSPHWLRHRPLFERFDAGGLRVRLFARDWEDPDEQEPGTVLHLALSELLELQVRPLRSEAGLWLEDCAPDPAAFHSLDTSPLRPWRQDVEPPG